MPRSRLLTWDWLLLGEPKVDLTGLVADFLAPSSRAVRHRDDATVATLASVQRDYHVETRLWVPADGAARALLDGRRRFCAVVLAYDATDPYSFQRVEYWRRLAAASTHSHTQFMLVATRCADPRRRVLTPEGVQLALEEGMLYFELDRRTPRQAALVVDLMTDGVVHHVETRHWPPHAFADLGIRRSRRVRRRRRSSLTCRERFLACLGAG